MLFKTKHRFVNSLLIPKIMRDLSAKIEKRINEVISTYLCIYNHVLGVQPLKKDESNSNINICKILHLPFDVLYYFLIMKMIPCEMH